MVSRRPVPSDPRVDGTPAVRADGTDEVKCDTDWHRDDSGMASGNVTAGLEKCHVRNVCCVYRKGKCDVMTQEPGWQRGPRPFNNFYHFNINPMALQGK